MVAFLYVVRFLFRDTLIDSLSAVRDERWVGRIVVALWTWLVKSKCLGSSTTRADSASFMSFTIQAVRARRVND